MTSYRRNFIPGGTFFFTVNLAERQPCLLTEHVEKLRHAFQETRSRHPFSVAARVVLPDHLHTRYWEHTIRDEADFARHVEYIHINPVKHGYVTRVRDWPHSSFHRMVRDGTYPEDWAGDAADIKGDFGERRS